MGRTLRKLEWYLRQLLPLTYRSHYTEVASGRRYFTVWQMWFGRCFNVKTVEVA